MNNLRTAPIHRSQIMSLDKLIKKAVWMIQTSKYMLRFSLPRACHLESLLRYIASQFCIHLCIIIFSTITVWNANSNNYTITWKIVHLPWPSSSPLFGIRWIWINKINYSFYFFTLLRHIVAVNSVAVTVFYLVQALHRRIIVYRILSKIQRIRANLATAIYDNKVGLFII